MLNFYSKYFFSTYLNFLATHIVGLNAGHSRIGEAKDIAYIDRHETTRLDYPCVLLYHRTQ